MLKDERDLATSSPRSMKDSTCSRRGSARLLWSPAALTRGRVFRSKIFLPRPGSLRLR